MSSDADEQSSYTPAKVPSKSSRLTLDEMKDVTEHFKKLFEDSSLAWWIRLAGLGAVAEALHIVWLLLRRLLHIT